MSLSIPAEFKAITPYIKRAEELELDGNQDSKIVAYYCLLYALEKGMGIQTSNKSFLYTLMEKAEKSKASSNIDHVDNDKHIICENFAMLVFKKADDEDRAGVATNNTAKTFYAAATFFDILEQFGTLDQEIIEKRKYSKWRSADIIRAIKEGRTPSAPTSQQTETLQSEITIINNIPSAPTFTPLALAMEISQESVQPSSQPLIPSSALQQQLQQQQPLYTPTPPHVSSFQQPVNNTFITETVSAIVQGAASVAGYANPFSTVKPAQGALDSKLKDAIEQSQFAIAAIKYKDIPLARQKLEEALRLLT